jgi:hypothetical protein
MKKKDGIIRFKVEEKWGKKVGRSHDNHNHEPLPIVKFAFSAKN